MKHGSAPAYLLGPSMVAALFGARIALPEWFQGVPYTLLLAPVLLAAYWGGFGPGLLALAAGGLVSGLLISLAGPEGGGVPDYASLLVFLGVAALGISVIGQLQRRTALLDEERNDLAAARAAEGRVRESLRENERLFRTMLDTLPQIAFIISADGSADYYNQRFADYVGHPIGRAPADRAALLHPDDQPRLTAARREAVPRDADYTIEARVRRHDGVYRWHSIRNKPLYTDGKAVAWLGTAEDIDDIHRLNEVLETRIAERTRERDAAREHLNHVQRLEALGQLTGGVAHDFNNLLTAIVGNLDLLDRHVTSETGKRLMESAHRAAARGARLIQSLLVFARRQTLRPEAVKPNDLITELGELLHRAAGDTIEIALQLDPTLDQCLIDAAQFQAALLNLVVNARDAMPPAGGRIEIATVEVAVEEGDQAARNDAKPGRYARIMLSDNGRGMSPSVLARAFEPFFTTKDIGKGSGLGLSQVYGFARQSGGFVELASELGTGTTVSLYLPRTEERMAAAAEPVILPPPAGVETILVAEDDPDIRAIVADSLRSLGYRVLTCDDGITALALLQRPERIDLLFADISMPNGMLGDELARRAIKLRPDLRALLTSGLPAGETGSETFGDFPILRKPYRREELASAIRAILDN
ncbi:MAG TPA: ATP-binding protein [Aliidongia sp.]|nr:ATP-binding protein [Aliidongia sp.]